jgi:hypothetical protein
MTRLTFFPIITNFTTFETKDSMGLIFNSCLEQFAKTLKEESQTYGLFSDQKRHYGEYPFNYVPIASYVQGFLSRDRISRKTYSIHKILPSALYKQFKLPK